MNGQAPHTTALLTTAPDLQYYGERSIIVTGGSVSTYFRVDLHIESVEFVPPQVVEISPAASSFLPQQHFDAALLLPIGSTIVSAQASANGVPLSLVYPGTCTLAPPNSAGRPAILCPDAHTALGSMQPASQIDWSVELSGGIVLTKSVGWTLIQ